MKHHSCQLRLGDWRGGGEVWPPPGVGKGRAGSGGAKDQPLEIMPKKKAKLSELLKSLKAEYFISSEINTRISGNPKAKM